MKRFFPLALCVLLLCPVARGLESEKLVALTFDDCPAAFADELLEALEARKANATFFLRGDRMAEDSLLVPQMLELGHEVGLQGYAGEDMTVMSRRKIGETLAKARALLPKGYHPRLLRPANGLCTDGIRQVAEVTGLSLIGWSADPWDWQSGNRGLIGRVADGDIIRIREVNSRSLRAVVSLVDQLQRQGYRFVTVTELARARRVKLRPGVMYAALPPVKQEPPPAEVGNLRGSDWNLQSSCGDAPHPRLPIQGLVSVAEKQLTGTACVS